MNKPKHVNLTTLSPIEYRHDDPRGRIEDIREYLAREGRKPHDQQLFASCDMAHMIRLQVLDDVIPAMGQENPDSLKSKYLLMVAEISGSVDDFLDFLYSGPYKTTGSDGTEASGQVFSWKGWGDSSRRHSKFVSELWGRCIGYPRQADGRPYTGAVFFRQYMKRCRVKITLPFAAYDDTVSEVLNYQKRQEDLAEFAMRTQGLPAEELHKQWQEYIESDR